MVGLGVIVIPIMSILCVIITIIFFWKYGAFKHPWYASILMITSASIPSIMIIGALPYDISNCLFGTQATDSTALKLFFQILYWVSFALSWVINPLVVSYLSYSNSISLKHRIWMTIRENLIFYGVVFGLVAVGVIILVATNRMTIDSIFPLAIALANVYGLLLLCLCLGHSFVSLPRDLWQQADPSYKYTYSLFRISQEINSAAKILADGEAVLSCAYNARHQLTGNTNYMFQEKGESRIERLNLIKGTVPIPDGCFEPETKNKAIKKFQNFDWSRCTDAKLEDFFSIMDKTITSLTESSSFIEHSAHDAMEALQQYQSHTRSKLIVKRTFSIVLIVFNVICLWGEICLMFNPKFSLFYQISHVTMPQLVDILLISTPIITYLTVLGCWSLMHLKIGSFYKFVKGTTNANTLNYFANFLCRLGPTIGYHYMQQIGAEGSQFVKVMGVMDVVVFIGDKWITLIVSPILLILVIVFFVFKLDEKFAMLCGCDCNVFESEFVDFRELEKGEKVLTELEPAARELVEEGFTYRRVLDGSLPQRYRRNKKFGELEENLNN
ncbi:LMBR1-like conserved region family protein [Histomonas meleagridis]|uniref:LMBR1-like conserved region family protein n=1 Tax=Histomonas meleagridis TaxID=135588 RepID=UPI00355960DF|nr:LMBR1-like conserved region family protein [Histomonas meleagridis]KAH0803274.1 LMBR1-like conserved region family protein [Histomonas meleagridis]